MKTSSTRTTESVFNSFADAKIVGLYVSFKDKGGNPQVNQFVKAMTEAGYEVEKYGLTQIDGGPNEWDNVYGYQIRVKFKRTLKFNAINARKIMKAFAGYDFYGPPRIDYQIQKHGKMLQRDVSAHTMADLKENLEYIAKREKESTRW
jgi:hypothetical protein